AEPATKENARAGPGIFSLIHLVSRTSYRQKNSSPLQTRSASSDFAGYPALPVETLSAVLSAAWSGSLASPAPPGTSGLQAHRHAPGSPPCRATGTACRFGFQAES